jgi:hypothetical protein
MRKHLAAAVYIATPAFGRPGPRKSFPATIAGPGQAIQWAHSNANVYARSWVVYFRPATRPVLVLVKLVHPAPRHA